MKSLISYISLTLALDPKKQDRAPETLNPKDPIEALSIKNPPWNLY